MSRETWMPLAIVGGVAIVLAGAWSWMGSQREEARESEHTARVREREEAEAHETEEMRSESAALIGDILPGVELGTNVDAVRAARQAGAVTPSTSHTDPGYTLYQEDLPNGAQVMYAFDERDGSLARVQVLSQMDGVEGIAPHLAAMHDRYGAPTGIWDCRDGSGIGTRRFTWRRSHTALADILLTYAGRVSVTLYATTNEQMARSLRRAGCQPTPPDQIDQFPTSSPEQIQAAQHEEEGTAP